MKEWKEYLDKCNFHQKLGSQSDRIDRIALLARKIAPHMNADANIVEDAARLAKIDLGSNMVREFPDLQGVMAEYYIKAAGYSDDIARAAREHYAPLGPNDNVPSAPISVIVALADKIDMLAGFWTIDEKPTGSKDPFSLRRSAIGLIRLIVENDLSLSLRPVFKIWSEIFYNFNLRNENAVSNKDLCGTTENLLNFIHGRLKVYLHDRGIRRDVIDACLGIQENDDLYIITELTRALSKILETEDGKNLIQGFKRANNILIQAETSDEEKYCGYIGPSIPMEPEELALHDALNITQSKINLAFPKKDFTAIMTAMADLRYPIDRFFAKIHINVNDKKIRHHRLHLLGRVRALCLSVADISKISTQDKSAKLDHQENLEI